MYSKDASNISIEYWKGAKSVGMHRHKYYELFIMAHGSCKHVYHDSEMLLIPGDAIIIPADNPHGFSLYGEVAMHICQFYLADIDIEIAEMLQNDAWFGSEVAIKDTVYWQELLTMRENTIGMEPPQYELNSHKQGVIHLTPAEYSFVVSLLQQIYDEQESPNEWLLPVKRKYLEVVLLACQKALVQQNQRYQICSKKNQKIIANILIYIEKNLNSEFDFNEIASQYSLSVNYFRRIFKEVTGLAPVSYVNRLRMIRAYDYLKNKGLNINEAAEAVGIYDLNYFSRLFKKVMGVPPNKV
ncbi:MAG: AraC family transcriptional regulator [Eubacteriales bacterium]|nr:AraC family transcriptional regulator [Eubacteriales bacterium]